MPKNSKQVMQMATLEIEQYSYISIYIEFV